VYTLDDDSSCCTDCLYCQMYISFSHARSCAKGLCSESNRSTNRGCMIHSFAYKMSAWFVFVGQSCLDYLKDLCVKELSKVCCAGSNSLSLSLSLSLSVSLSVSLCLCLSAPIHSCPSAERSKSYSLFKSPNKSPNNSVCVCVLLCVLYRKRDLLVDTNRP
jgi:hypothetical protein